MSRGRYRDSLGWAHNRFKRWKTTVQPEKFENVLKFWDEEDNRPERRWFARIAHWVRGQRQSGIHVKPKGQDEHEQSPV